MPATRHIHTADPVYAPPVLRAPSPTGSLSTEYGPDEGDWLNEMHQSEFERYCEEQIGIHPTQKRAEPDSLFRVPLLPKPRDKNEEIALHRKIMENLRQKVREVEEEELYEAHIKQKFTPAVEDQATTNDVDAILRSMLGPSPNQSGSTATRTRDNVHPDFTFGGFQSLNGRS